MKTLRLAALIVAALLLAGCSGASAEEPEPSSAPTVEAAASEEASVEEASVEEWTSVVARAQEELDDTLATLEAEQCTATLAASPDGLMCQVRMLTATYSVSTIELKMQAPTTPEAAGFIAVEPPAAIASLWERTTEAASAAADAGAAWSDAGCSSGQADSCLQLGSEFERAMDSLDSEFAGWAPYL